MPVTQRQRNRHPPATGPALVVRFGLPPQVLLAQALHQFESNVRSASILGVVGASGIGLRIAERIKVRCWDQVSFIILLTPATVALIDVASARVRARLIGQRPAAAAAGSGLHPASDYIYPRRMERKRPAGTACPIARSLEHLGERWSLLIMRDALAGLTRFDAFQNSLGIAPNMLARRLAALVEAGLLERRRYSERPPRDEYLPTDRGRDAREVLLALLAFGNRHFAPEGASVVLVDADGVPADPVMVDRRTGQPLAGPGFRVAAGPAASGAVLARLARPRPIPEDPAA